MAASSSTGSKRALSIIDDIGMYNSGCGYCNSGRRSSVSHGLSAYTLTVSDYQDLLDRGWRRSGTHLYKPDGDHTCCPVYTIRLEADAFVPSKEQKRVMRRVQRYLDGYERQQPVANASAENGALHSPEEITVRISTALTQVATEWIQSLQLGEQFELPEISVRRVAEKTKKQLKSLSSEPQYTSNAAFLLSVKLRRMRLSNDGTVEDISPAIIADALASRLQDSQQLERGVSVTSCKGHLNFQTSDMKASNISNCKSDSSRENSNRYQPTAKRRRLELSIKPSSFDPEEFELYKRYQVAVHQDQPQDIREKHYRGFLVDSPLIPYQEGSNSYGSFHQQYRIDGRLVAVGVVDILPRCLSSKYLIWDPDYAFLSLGKFSVLKEIEWVQNAHRLNPQLRYYYLGYYIHSCPKMRYKAAYHPSELLCPVRFQWIPFHVARPLLGHAGSVCISDSNGTVVAAEPFQGETSLGSTQDGDDERNEMQQEVMPAESGYQAGEQSREMDSAEAETLGEIPVMVNGRCWKFKILETSEAFAPAILRILKQRLYEYWRLVGTELASRMVYTLRFH